VELRKWSPTDLRIPETNEFTPRDYHTEKERVKKGVKDDQILGGRRDVGVGFFLE